MINYIKTNIHAALFITLLIVTGTPFAQSGNNAYVIFNESSYAGIMDSDTLTADATKSAYQYFDNPLYSNDSISVEAWVYLIGENPGVKMPIIYRSFSSGYETFSLYIQDRIAYFEIGDGTGAVSTAGQPLIPAFRWVHLVGTYDGQNLKLYYGGNLVQSLQVTLGSGYNSGDGGLYIGKSDEGTFRGLMDEVRIWRFALPENNINGSGGNGNPSENFPQSIAEYLNGRWSFTDFTFYNGIKALTDRSTYNNHLRVYDIDQIVNSKNPPFFVVNSTGDAPDLLPGDGKADAGNGETTLRSAIQEANAFAGEQTIYFYIPGSGSQIIQPATALPDLIEPVIINATFQSGYNGSPLIEIDGTNAGLNISGGASTVNGLLINNTSGFGLTLFNTGGNTIVANQISGININSPGNNIYDNKITNSISDGIALNIAADNNLIGVSGENSIYGNAGYGISQTNASNNQISNNIIRNNAMGGVNLINSNGTFSNNRVVGNTGV